MNGSQPIFPQGTAAPSATDPIDSAWQLMVRYLFRPADPVKWFLLGLGVFFAELFTGGGNGGNFSNIGSPGGGPGGPGSVDPQVMHYIDLVDANLLAILVLVGVAWLVLSAIFGGIVMWIRSVGDFMVVDNLANNRALVELPFRELRPQHTSLFLVRLVVMLSQTLIGLVLVLPALYTLWKFIRSIFLTDDVDLQLIPWVPLVLLIVPLILAQIIFALFTFLVDHLAVNIMYSRRIKCVEALKLAWGTVVSAPGTVFLFLLLRIVLTIAFGIANLLLILATCCILGCLEIIPYIGRVVLLPWYAFERAYSMYFVQQFGFAMFNPAAYDPPPVYYDPTWQPPPSPAPPI